MRMMLTRWTDLATMSGLSLSSSTFSRFSKSSLNDVFIVLST